MNLHDHVSLAEWYRQHPEAPEPGDVGARLVWGICRALTLPRTVMIEPWLGAFEAFLTSTSDARRDVLRAIGIFQSCNADFLEAIGDAGELATQQGRITAFRGVIARVADATGIAALHFLAAWAALNAGDLNACVEQCEKVAEPYASIHTIHGQALLELGRVDEAIEVLSIATKLSPTELLAWFQLAKAYHVSGSYEGAWLALRQCHRLAPQSEEVALFMGMTALHGADRKSLERAGAAYDALGQFLPQMPGNSIVVATLAQLACMLEDKSKLDRLLTNADWRLLKASPDFVRRLPPVLRALNELGWMDLAGQLLRYMTGDRVAS